MTPNECCCPICWAMPVDRDDLRTTCASDGLSMLMVVVGEPGAVHRERIALAEWISEPLREWPRELGYREAPSPKIVNHPEFDRGRRDAVANRPRDPQSSHTTIKGTAYLDGYAVGEWKRHSLCPMPARNEDGVSVSMVALLADVLARYGGDRAQAGLYYQYGSYIASQQFQRVAKYLPLVPLNDPPRPPDRDWQPGLFSHSSG